MSCKIITSKNESLVTFMQSTLFADLNNTNKRRVLVENLFQSLIERDKDIKMDFSEVELVDSLFIGQLLSLHRHLIKKGKQLKILNLKGLLQDLFKKLRFEDLGIELLN